MRARTWIAVIATVVFLTAGGTLVGGLLAMPDEGLWAVTVGTEMAGFVPVDASLSVEALYRQVIGGALAGAGVGAVLGVAIVVLLSATLRRNRRDMPRPSDVPG